MVEHEPLSVLFHGLGPRQPPSRKLGQNFLAGNIAEGAMGCPCGSHLAAALARFPFSVSETLDVISLSKMLLYPSISLGGFRFGL